MHTQRCPLDQSEKLHCYWQWRSTVNVTESLGRDMWNKSNTNGEHSTWRVRLKYSIHLCRNAIDWIKERLNFQTSLSAAFTKLFFLLLQIIHRPGCKHFSRTNAVRCWILKRSFRAVNTQRCSHEFREKYFKEQNQSEAKITSIQWYTVYFGANNFLQIQSGVRPPDHSHNIHWILCVSVLHLLYF